jgi:hypothetical protein
MIQERIPWVIKTLTSSRKARDSNEYLYYLFLKDSGYDVNKPIKDFLIDMENKVVPYIDSIGRASRKVQEEIPSLRGKNWLKRQKKETEIREEIRNI